MYGVRPNRRRIFMLLNMLLDFKSAKAVKQDFKFIRTIAGKV